VIAPRFDADAVGLRLRSLRRNLDELEALRGVDASRLEDEPLVRAAAERLLQVAVDLAIDCNAHIAAAMLGRAPANYRESFVDAATAGAIDQALADRLAPAAGLRNVLAHRYVDIRVDLVAEAVDEVLDGFSIYVREVAAFVERQRG
jgi:uncharacterized protein YutE (UPF0331/DUF86 family)